MTIYSPFAGFPATKLAPDGNGKIRFIIRPRFLTPLRAHAARFCANVLAAGLTIEGCVILINHPGLPGWLWPVALAGPWLMRPVFRGTLGFLFKKRKHLTLTDTSFKVHGIFGTRSYDRRFNHKFSLLEHDYARAEKRRHELNIREAAGRGEVIIKLPIYGESFHLSYDYLGQRNDILTVYGVKDALAIRARLEACDEALNAHAGAGDGFATRPEDQWADQPGDLPEDD